MLFEPEQAWLHEAASSPGANKKNSCESLYEGLHEVVHHIIGAQRGVGYERSG